MDKEKDFHDVKDLIEDAEKAIDDIEDDSIEESTEDSTDSSTEEDKVEEEKVETEATEEEEIPKEFHKHPRWQKLHAEAKEAKELREQLEELKSKEDEPVSLDNVSASDMARLIEAAKKDGLLQDSKPEKVEQPLYDLNNMTKEQRDLYNFTKFVNSQENKTLQDKLKALETKATEFEQRNTLEALNESENQAKERVTELGLDWKEISGKVQSKIKQGKSINPNWGVGLDVVDVTNMVLAEGGYGTQIGKKKAQAEIKAVAEKKKKAQSETDSTSVDAGTDYNSMSTKSLTQKAMEMFTK